MNSIRKINELNAQELQQGTSIRGSWHNDYNDTAYIYIGGIPLKFTEADLATVFSQYGNPVHVKLARDVESGKSKGFAWLKYEDQRSTVLAVDNLNGIELLGRTIKVDHAYYSTKNEEEDDLAKEMLAKRLRGTVKKAEDDQELNKRDDRSERRSRDDRSSRRSRDARDSDRRFHGGDRESDYESSSRRRPERSERSERSRISDGRSDRDERSGRDSRRSDTRDTDSESDIDRPIGQTAIVATADGDERSEKQSKDEDVKDEQRSHDRHHKDRSSRSSKSSRSRHRSRRDSDSDFDRPRRSKRSERSDGGDRKRRRREDDSKPTESSRASQPAQSGPVDPDLVDPMAAYFAKK